MDPASVPFSIQVPLDRVTAVAMESGAHFTLSGVVMASGDGASFDASQLFDFAAGGLRVVDSPAHGTYVLEGTSTAAPACVAAGAPAPCLVPRLAELAHARLHTASELASTLSGSIDLHSQWVARDGSATETRDTIVGFVVILAVLGGLVWAIVAVARRMARDSMRRVRIAARRALKATRGDATLDPVRPRIEALVDRARQLDLVRRACAAKLRLVDRAALSTERAEAGRLETERAAAVAEIQRIESTLRVVALRAGARDAQPSGADPVEALLSELDIRDQALVEANLP